MPVQNTAGGLIFCKPGSVTAFFTRIMMNVEPSPTCIPLNTARYIPSREKSIVTKAGTQPPEPEVNKKKKSALVMSCTVCNAVQLRHPFFLDMTWCH